MTEAEIKRIVRETVQETLLSLGVDTEDPIEVQRDFQYLRDWRQNAAAVKRHGILVAVGIAVAGFLALVWMALKTPGG